MAKYTPLQNYLFGLPVSQREVTLTFNRIEEIIRDKLPRSAYQHRAWWGNEKDGIRVNAHSWMNAGWKVDEVNQRQKLVRFIRK